MFRSEHVQRPSQKKNLINLVTDGLNVTCDVSLRVTSHVTPDAAEHGSKFALDLEIWLNVNIGVDILM